MTKSIKVIEMNRVNDNTPLVKAVKVRTIKDAKRLMSKLITAFQEKTIDGRDAKDMAYLLTVFLQIVKDFELEKRVEEIEKAIQERQLKK